MTSRCLSAALLIAVIGCGPPALRADDVGEQQSTSETGDGDGDGDDKPGCGNGIVEPGENCDDGDGQGYPCSDDCQYSAFFCGIYLRECGDTIDNDDDGLVDLDDPDCLSPCDDNETSFSFGLPVVDSDACNLDCYWDRNNVAGDDKCEHQVKCDPLDPGAASGCAYDPDLPPLYCDDAVQTLDCLGLCPPLTPNGCDCFGCCQLGDQTIFLGIQTDGPGPCGAATPELCPSCTLDMDCFNPCDAEGCELCFLDGLEDLAPGCREPACPDGVPSCTSSYECPEETICKTGCCVRWEA